MPGTPVAAAPLVAGWYGKLPSLGDFATRRLPQDFIAAWDAWLQQGLAASRARLGSRWLDAYLTSPIWRFALLPGACGEQAWAGVLMPSVDKVGRHFPLTLAVRLEAHPDPVGRCASVQPWYAELESLALAALDMDFQPEDLERGLAEHPFPLPADFPEGRQAPGLADWWQGAAAAPHALDLGDPSALAGTLAAAARYAFAARGRGRSLWWRLTGDEGPMQLLCFSGLPAAGHFSLLLEGRAP